MLVSEFRRDGIIARRQYGPIYSTELESHGLVVPTGRNEYQAAFEVKCRQFLSEVRQFWETHAEEVTAWISASEALCLLHADSADTVKSNIRRTGVYFDTACIIDHLYLHRDSGFGQELAAGRGLAAQRVFPAYFENLSLEPEVMANCDPPLAVLYPSFSARNPAHDIEVERECGRRAYDLVAELLDLPRYDGADCDFSAAVNNVPREKIRQVLRTQPIFAGLSEEQVQTVAQAAAFKDGLYFDRTDVSPAASSVFAMTVVASRSIYHVLRSEYEAERLPIEQYLHRRVYREAFAWLARLEARRSRDSGLITAEEASLLSVNSERLKWIGNLSIEELVQVRNDGLMDDMRALFRLSAATLRRASSPHEAALEVQSRLESKFAEHQAEMARKEDAYWRRFKRSVSSLCINVSVSLISALVPILPVEIAAAAYSVGLGGKSGLDLIRSGIERKRELREDRRKPVALLLATRNKDRRTAGVTLENAG